MLKFVVSLSLFFLSPCPAFSEEDHARELILEAGYQSFRKLQDANKICVQKAVINQMTVLSMASLSGGLIVEQLKHNMTLPLRYFKLARAGTLTAMIATVMEAIYYLTTDENLFTPYNFNALKHALTQEPPFDGKDSLAAYYATREGFIEFLNVDSEADIRSAMNTNLSLAVGSIALLRFVKISDCRILESLSPDKAETLTLP